MEATEEMLVAGLKEAEPLGELIDWQDGFGRDEMQTTFKAMIETAWQPIETAPRDDTAVLGKLTDSDIPMPVRYRNGKWIVSWDLYPLSQNDGPTHWMPMPPPPSNA